MRHRGRQAWGLEGRIRRYESTKCPAQAAKLVSQGVLRPVIKQVALRRIMLTRVPQRKMLTQVSLRELLTQLPLRCATEVVQEWMFVKLVPQQELMTQMALRELMTQCPLRPLVKQEALRCPRESQWAKCRRFSFVVAVESA